MRKARWIGTTMSRMQLAAAVLAIASFAPALHAQAKPAPNINGHVLTPTKDPISGVEVVLGGTGAVIRTDESGAFRFLNVSKGPQTLTFRRIGFLPAAIGVLVPETSDTLTVTLISAKRVLDSVVVTEHLNVLAGIVVDSSNHPLPGATVDIIGTKNSSTTTDADGWFSFTSVHSGTVIVRARKEGYAMDTHSMNLDNWRGLLLRLEPLKSSYGAVKRMNLSGFGNTVEYTWAETQQRMTMKGMRAEIIPREELAPFGGTALGEAIRLSRKGAPLAADLSDARNQVCVVEDGHAALGSMSLDHFRASDVDFVELYPPGTEVSGSLADKLRFAGCSNVRNAGLSRSRGPFYAVIWTR